MTVVSVRPAMSSEPGGAVEMNLTHMSSEPMVLDDLTAPSNAMTVASGGGCVARRALPSNGSIIGDVWPVRALDECSHVVIHSTDAAQ